MHFREGAVLADVVRHTALQLEGHWSCESKVSRHDIADKPSTINAINAVIPEDLDLLTVDDPLSYGSNNASGHR